MAEEEINSDPLTLSAAQRLGIGSGVGYLPGNKWKKKNKRGRKVRKNLFSARASVGEYLCLPKSSTATGPTPNCTHATGI